MDEHGLHASLFDNRHIIMVVIDPDDGAILDANPAAVDFYGWSRDELRAKRITDINTLDAEDIRAEMQRAEQEQRKHFYFPHRLADGSVRNVEVYSGPVLWDGRQVLLSVVLDVTERDFRIQELASEALARRIMVEQSRDGIVVLESDGAVYEANRSFAEMHGYSPDEAGALHIWDWNHSVSPDSLVELVRETTHEGARFETVHTRRDGSTFDVEVVANASMVAGRKLVFCICRDVTERNRLEETRRERERFQSTILETALDGFFTISVDGWIQEANESFARITGYTRTELERMHLSEIDADESPADVAAHIERARAAGAEVFFARYRRKDGSIVDVEISTTFIDVRGGRFVSFCRDVTERKAAERALEHSHDLLRYIIEHDRSSIAVFDTEMRYIYVSQRFIEDYRLKTSDIIGRSHYDVFPEIPDTLKEIHRRSIAGEVLSAENDIFSRADGSTDVVRWECRPWYQSDGSIGGLVLYTEVITARVDAERALADSEERLRSLSDNMPDGYIYQVETAPDGSGHRFTHVSAGVERLRGVSAASVLADPEALYGQTVPEDRQRVAEIEARALATMSRFEAEVRYVTPTGATRWARLVSMPRRLDDGRIIWDGVETDVTARRQAEFELEQHKDRLEELVAERTEELDRANRELIEASHAKSAFLARMSHELRTPLNAIIGFSALMLHGMAGSLDDDQHTKVELIHSSAKHLLELINEVLEVASVEMGGAQLVESEFDAREVLTEVADELRASAADKGLDLTVVLPETAVDVTSDRRRLRQILSNLVGNAIKFTGDGSVEATVRVDGDDTVSFLVADTGPGIPEGECERVFEPFAQLENADVRSPVSGTGLGLAIVREFAGMMGGSVTVESQVGSGSTFVLMLPRRTDRVKAT